MPPRPLRPFRLGPALARAGLALLLLLALGGCGPFDGPQSALDPKGPVARQQYETFLVTLWVTLFIFLTVGGTLAYTLWRFRLRAQDDPQALPRQSHGHPLIEAGLILASTIMLAIIAVPTFQGILLMKRLPAELRDGGLEINVNGYQWWWEFEYPAEGVLTANEMVIPAGRPVKLNLRSGDVIHSFWVPKLAGKVDLIPGQDNVMWIQADEPGYFWGQCAEFCGDSHAYMLFRVVAMPPEEYQAWIERTRAGPALPLATLDQPDAALAPEVRRGMTLFREKCLSCHRVGPEGGITGPNLTHLASRTTLAAGWLENTPENLHRWILRPDEVKPGNNMWRGVPMPGGVPMTGLREAGLTPAQVDDLVSYLTRLP